MSKAKSRSQSPSLRGADDTNKDNNNANILSTLSSPIITSSLSLLNVGSQRNIDNEQKDNIKMFNDNKFNAKEYIKEARAIKQSLPVSLPKSTNVNVTINKTQTKIPKKDETKKVIIGTSATAPTVASSTGITKPAATTNLVANVTSTSANASVSDSESDSDLF